MSTRAMAVIATLTWTEAVRNRLVWLTLAIVGIGIGSAQFAAAIALTEAAQVQSAVAGSSLRVGAVFLLGLFIVTAMVRENNDKGRELFLSLPLARWRFVVGKLCGFAVLAALLATACTLAVALYAPWPQVLIWGVSLGCELLIIAAFSLLCTFTFANVTSGVATVAGFYILARAIGALQLMAHGPMVFDAGTGYAVGTAIVDAIAFVVPDLYRFARADWLVYHSASSADLVGIGMQTAVYVALLAAASVFDLYRKNL